MRISFSEEELIDLLWAWAAISLSFAIVLSKSPYGFLNFQQNLLIAGLSVGIAFIFHEISHKILAQKYNCWAEFRKFDLGLILSVVFSFSGFIFAAPGAVLISGFISEKENGKISLAGPVANLVLAFFFLFLLYFFEIRDVLLSKIISYGLYTNSWLAFFNLLPFPPLDGSKVINWSIYVWIVAIGISAFLVFYL
jgi:Zn-dependent protease